MYTAVCCLNDIAWLSSQTYNSKHHLCLPRLVIFINKAKHVKVFHVSHRSHYMKMELPCLKMVFICLDVFVVYSVA